MRHRTAQKGMGLAIAASVWAAIGGVGSLAGLALAQTPSLRFIQPSPGYDLVSIEDIADDGTVVAISFFSSGIRLTEPVFRETPAGVRTEYGLGIYPRISGDGRVVAVNRSGPSLLPMLFHDDGSVYETPTTTFRGAQSRGRIINLDHDGSVAVILRNGELAPGVPTEGTFVWNRDEGTVRRAPFPIESTWEQHGSISSDGRIVTGSIGPSLFGPVESYVWDMSQPAFTPTFYPDGTPLIATEPPIMSGDGSTIFVRDINTVMIRDGVSTIWNPGGPIGSTPWLFPDFVSNDGRVAVGSGGSLGGWIWTEETGAMLLPNYMRSIGVDVPLDARTGLLLVSGDGRHIAGGILSNTMAGKFVLTIPTPGASVVTVVVGCLASCRRRQRERGTEVRFLRTSVFGRVPRHEVWAGGMA